MTDKYIVDRSDTKRDIKYNIEIYESSAEGQVTVVFQSTKDANHKAGVSLNEKEIEQIITALKFFSRKEEPDVRFEL